MQSKSKLILLFAALLFCTAAAYTGYIKYQTSIQKQNSAYYQLGRLQGYNQTLKNYFDARIKIESYDRIEKKISRAEKIVNALQKSPLKPEKYEQSINTFEKLYEHKDRYKALSSQIVMSLLFVKKHISDHLTPKKQQLYSQMLELGIEPKKGITPFKKAIQSYHGDPIFKKHVLFIISHLQQLRSIPSFKEIPPHKKTRR